MKYAASVLVLALFASVAIAAQGPTPLNSIFPSSYQPERRSAIDDLPDRGDSIESFLQFCESVIHALESELPRKSCFRSLFIDKARLSSGFDKHVKFSYYDLIKNKIDPSL